MFSKESLVFIIGLILVVFPYIGIPESWRVIGTSFFGVVLVFVGYALRRALYLKHIQRTDGERASDSFVETTDPLFK
jgi:uncharacterized membrane protein